MIPQYTQPETWQRPERCQVSSCVQHEGIIALLRKNSKDNTQARRGSSINFCNSSDGPLVNTGQQHYLFAQNSQ